MIYGIVFVQPGSRFKVEIPWEEYKIPFKNLKKHDAIILALA